MDFAGHKAFKKYICSNESWNFLNGVLFPKIFIEFDTVLLQFYVLFGCEPCVILKPCVGMEPTPQALEGKVLPTGLQASSLLNSLEEIAESRLIASNPFREHCIDKC